MTIELVETYENPTVARRPKQAVTIDLERGEAVFDAQPGEEPSAALDRLVREMWTDVDDRTIQLLDVKEVTFWGNPDAPFKRFKASIRQPSLSRSDVDIDRLMQVAVKARPRQSVAPPAVGDATFVVAIADWQAGKATGGGVETMVDTVQRLRVQIERRWKTLQKLGVPLSKVAILCMGDLVESCSGHYSMQQFEVELDGREQTRLVRRLLYGLVDTAAGFAPEVLLAAVPGNHGEKRQGGKAYTSWSDNLDVEIPEQVGDILSANPDRFGHVTVALPGRDELTLVVDLSGTRVGMAHGHQFKGGSSVQAKALRWWERQSATRHVVGEADLLLSGHYHHFQCVQEGTHDGGTRTWMQCPTIDGGSPWWEHQGGPPTAAGTLTMVVSEGGWSHLEVLR